MKTSVYFISLLIIATIESIFMPHLYNVFCAYLEDKYESQPQPTTLSKKRLWHRCFPVNVVKFLRTPLLTEHLWATASEQKKRRKLTRKRIKCELNHFSKN